MQQLTIGTLLRGGSYKIEKVLGQGSFGITYLAEHTNLGRKVAIKEFFMKELNSRGEDGSITGMTDGSLSQNYCVKFQKEAVNLSRLDHPNIVRVTDSFSENGTFYYVMDYIDGQNLNDYIKQHNVSEQEAVEIIKSVADALIYMHEKHHMLHLDLKPGNIMRRNSDGHIFLIDFGLSKHYSNDGQPETSTTIGLGTPGYAPIEQGNRAKTGEFRPTIDVYALGATFYKLLTRDTPPPASDLVSDDELLENNLRAKDVSDGLIKVVVEAMCPNVRKRIQTIRDFKDSILDVLNTTHNSVLTLNVQENTEETLITSVEVEPVVESTTTKEANIDVSQESLEEGKQKKCSIFSFNGRVGRLVYLAAVFGGIFVCSLPMLILEQIGVDIDALSVCFGSLLFLCYYIIITVGAKRCHDLGHSGWFQLIPFYFFAMLFSYGDAYNNEYGNRGNGISKESFKKLVVFIVIACAILGIIGIRSVSSSYNAQQNADADTVNYIVNVENIGMNLGGNLGIYSGEAVDSTAINGYIPHGWGQMTFNDGRYYKGHFSFGEMDGSDAYFSYPNGDLYVGSFANNEFKEGKYTVKQTKEYFIGFFKNGQPSTGTWYDKNGNVLENLGCKMSSKEYKKITGKTVGNSVKEEGYHRGH